MEVKTMYYRKEGFIMGEDNRPDFKTMYENKANEKAARIEDGQG
jgi:hypothetical protein